MGPYVQRQDPDARRRHIVAPGVHIAGRRSAGAVKPIQRVSQAARPLLQDDGFPAALGASRSYPRFQRHPGRQVERVRIVDRHPVIHAVERQRATEFAVRCPGGAANRPVVRLPRNVGCRRQAAFVQTIRSHRAGGGGG